MIDFRNVEKLYSGVFVLNKVSFRINSNERVGLVGPNGAGKSTILNMIIGEISPDAGEIIIPKNMRIGCMKQQLPTGSEEISLLNFTADAIPELKTIAEKLKNIEHELNDNNSSLDSDRKNSLLKQHGTLQTQYEHLGAYTLKSDAEAALTNLGFKIEDFNKPLKSFSGGWQMRAMLARVLISNPDILLLDEPSNYLDIPAVEWLCKFLKSYIGTLILISHDRFLLKKLTDVTLEVNSGQVTRYAGDYDYYRKNREEKMQSLIAAKKNADRKKEHLERTIDRFRAKSSKASQAKSWQKALDKMEDIEIPDELSYNGMIKFPDPPPCGSESARIENLSFHYPNNEANPIFNDINLAIDRGDKIAFIGYNGMGKTTLLKLLVGKLAPNAGKVVIGHNVIIGYQAQEFKDILEDEMSVYDVVRANLKAGASQNNLMNILGAFGFSGEAASKPCKVLSGGEKIRLSFARIFVNPPNFLILDEPTTHLDIAARELLQKALSEYQGTVCLVSHDIEFVRNVANTIIAMERPKIRKYFGNYDYYLEKSTELGKANIENSPKELKKSVSNSAETTTFDSKERRRERAKQREKLAAAKKDIEKKVVRIEKDLERLQARQEELALLLADVNANINFQMTNRELFDIQTKIAQKTEEWETAALELEEIIESFKVDE
ncbi:MAG: ATP-binding cassette domain-containing protein [Lentisphaeria bacterium]|nr:ATP-binding cassette domain-containing protein [Lentisphaeria bacterium]